METKRVSFSEQIRIALSKPLHYRSLFRQTVTQHIGYFSILLVLVTVIQCVIPMTAYIKSSGGMAAVAYEAVPQFSFEDGILYVDRVIDYESAGVRVIIDTTQDSFAMSDAVSVANSMEETLPVVYLISERNVVCSTLTSPVSLSTLNLTLNNDILYRQSPVIITGVILYYLIRTAVSYLVSALFFTFFGMVLNRALKLKLKFREIFLIALYAKSVEIILAAILEVLGFTLLYYVGTIIGIFITCNYMTKGMTSLLLKNKDPEKKDKDDRGNFMDFMI